MTRPGGRIIVVDCAKPAWWNPARYLLWPLLAALEPFALDLWRRPIEAPARAVCQRATLFGGLYQIVSFVKA